MPVLQGDRGPPGGTGQKGDFGPQVRKDSASHNPMLWRMPVKDHLRYQRTVVLKRDALCSGADVH